MAALPSSPSPSPSTSTPPQPPISQRKLPELPKLPTLSTIPSLYPGCCLTLSTVLLTFLSHIIRHSSEGTDPESTGSQGGDSEYTESKSRHSPNRGTNSTRERCILSIGSGTGLVEWYLQREVDGHVDGSRDESDGAGGYDCDGEEDGEVDNEGDSTEHGRRGRKEMSERRGKRSHYTVEGVEVYTRITCSMPSSSPLPGSTIASTTHTYLPANKTHIVKGTWEICPRAFDADVGVWLFVYPRQTGLVRGYVKMLRMLDAGGLKTHRGLLGEGKGGEVEHREDSSGGYLSGRDGEGGHEVVTRVEDRHENGTYEDCTHEGGRCEADTRETGPLGPGVGVQLIIWAGPKQDWTDYEDIFQSMRGWKVETCQSEEVGVMDFECLAMIRRQLHQSLPSS